MKYFDKKELKICSLNINSTIKDVITNLNKSSMQITLINSSSGNLIGVITDGDIRRGLLRGLDLNSKISSLIKKSFSCRKRYRAKNHRVFDENEILITYTSS